MNALNEIYSGFNSLLVGLRITLGQFFKPGVTVHYPRQTLKIPRRYRGHIELVANPETGKPLCFACKLCERACPSDCISLEGVKLEGDKRKTVASYQLDFTKCSLCGSCVEVCRDGAIRFSRDYNLAGVAKEAFCMDLVQRLREQLAAATPEAPSPKRQAQPEIPHPRFSPALARARNDAPPAAVPGPAATVAAARMTPAFGAGSMDALLPRLGPPATGRAALPDAHCVGAKQGEGSIP